MKTFQDHQEVMTYALSLARRGQGLVEPNPCVGAVVVNEQLQLLGAGWHERFGQAHAEVNALKQAGMNAQGATLFVTLEPCAHHGKTPPCTDAVIAAGIKKVVIAVADPAIHSETSGVSILKKAGIQVEVGIEKEAAEALLAPFTTLRLKQRPYVHGKWAMTLDGKIASRTGHSQWISNELSREKVHSLRGRMDVILTGIGSVLADDPLLTARPPGPRTPLRVVLDPNARLPVTSQLVKTLAHGPVMVCIAETADPDRIALLSDSGVEVFQTTLDEEGIGLELMPILHELGRRNLTNLLLEAGSKILGSFHDQQLIDEVHCFIAPKLVGGQQALSPVAGLGVSEIPSHSSLSQLQTEILGDNIYVNGLVNRDLLEP